ncbi:dihydrofolate reductase [Bacillus sp. OV322]|uniref:dihydrofolate reductase n=1 Tax=Bacillus sp. OV322 TaxID=1882764 RepID=UPI0008F22F5C|nr:dihydrofolate reductase [Bacillus sp. OV322]SFC76123.1 dihydrofolate reductase [Bacillus sp. OV322]
MISLMLAMDENRVIGKDNKLPWHLPADLQYFKKMTTGHSVIMGRKTFDSIGRLLPGRKNIILTKNKSFEAEGAEVYHNILELKKMAERENDEVFVIGGAEIFKEMLPISDRLYITHIHHVFEGDVFFPEVAEEQWSRISLTPGEQDEKNKYPFDFAVYEKKQS